MRIIKQISYEIDFNGVVYPVLLVYKAGKKNISYRYKNNCFLISAPYHVKKDTINKYLIEYAPRLLKRTNKPPLNTNNFIYILGKKIDKSHQKICFNDGSCIYFNNDEVLFEQLQNYLYKIIQILVSSLKDKMGIKENLKIRIKKMKTLYGSYSKKTKTLSFNLMLVHYNIDVIQSVVIHELSHYFVFDHSSKFYDVVLKYCPNYFKFDEILKKGAID